MLPQLTYNELYTPIEQRTFVMEKLALFIKSQPIAVGFAIGSGLIATWLFDNFWLSLLAFVIGGILGNRIDKRVE